MSSSWGINRTMAQIHALLLAKAIPLSVDEIIAALGISRGNASMSLRDLMDWGVVQRFRQPGDRKDRYICDDDMWHMVARVVRERKRRELDPTFQALRECIANLPQGDCTEPETKFRDRLAQFIEIFELVDKLYAQAFANDDALAQTISWLREGLKTTKSSS